MNGNETASEDKDNMVDLLLTFHTFHIFLGECQRLAESQEYRFIASLSSVLAFGLLLAGDKLNYRSIQIPTSRSHTVLSPHPLLSLSEDGDIMTAPQAEQHPGVRHSARALGVWKSSRAGKCHGSVRRPQ